MSYDKRTIKQTLQDVDRHAVAANNQNRRNGQLLSELSGRTYENGRKLDGANRRLDSLRRSQDTGNAIAAAQLVLQEKALAAQEEANEMLADIGLQVEEVNDGLHNISGQLSQTNRVLDELSKQARIANAFSAGQLQAQLGILDKLNHMDARQRITEYNKWTFTDGGKIYTHWEKQANKTIQFAYEATRRMNQARLKDIFLKAKRLIAEHPERLFPAVVPPTPPAKPVEPIYRGPAGVRPEPMIPKPISKFVYIALFIIAILVFFFITRAEVTAAQANPDIIQAGLGAIASIIYTLIQIIILTIIVALIIRSIDNSRQRTAERAHDIWLNEYYAYKAAYDEYTWQRQEWQEACVRWEDMYGSRAQARFIRDEQQRLIDNYIYDCLQRAEQDTPSNLRWASRSPRPSIRSMVDLIKKAHTQLLPEDEVHQLPDPMAIRLNTPDRLPASNPNMRAAMQEILNNAPSGMIRQ